jgi:hypothetical protein
MVLYDAKWNVVLKYRSSYLVVGIDSLPLVMTEVKAAHEGPDHIDEACVIWKRTSAYHPPAPVKTHLSMFLEKIIWENTFSTSKTSNSLNVWSGSLLGCWDWCEGCRSQSLTAHKTRPGGNRSAINMFASRVFRIERNCVKHQSNQYYHIVMNETHPIKVIWRPITSFPSPDSIGNDRISFRTAIPLVCVTQPEGCITNVPDRTEW